MVNCSQHSYETFSYGTIWYRPLINSFILTRLCTSIVVFRHGTKNYKRLSLASFRTSVCSECLSQD